MLCKLDLMLKVFMLVLSTQEPSRRAGSLDAVTFVVGSPGAQRGLDLPFCTTTPRVKCHLSLVAPQVFAANHCCKFPLFFPPTHAVLE